MLAAARNDRSGRLLRIVPLNGFLLPSHGPTRTLVLKRQSKRMRIPSMTPATCPEPPVDPCTSGS